MPEHPSEPRSIAPPVVLLVDDDDLVLALMLRALAGHVGTILLANGPAEAVTMLAQHRHPIDIMVTDVAMPQTSGAELAAIAQRHHPAITVLFISGFPHARSEGRVPPAAHLLIKPFSPDELRDAVLKLLG